MEVAFLKQFIADKKKKIRLLAVKQVCQFVKHVAAQLI